MVKCQKCGTENPDNATFCQECGSKLNQINEVASKVHGGGLKKWWNKQSSYTKDIIIVGGVLVLGFILFMGIVGMPNQYKSDEITTPEKTVETYGTDDGTFFSCEFYSFTHPLMDKISIGDKNSDSDEIFTGFTDPKGSEFKPMYSFFITVYKPEKANESAFEYINSDKSGEESIDNPTYPIKSLQIAGVNGYQYDYDYIYSDVPSVKNRKIVFVKNGLLYKILFVSDLDKMDYYQGDIDTVVNSFTVK